jgi:ribonuclease D
LETPTEHTPLLLNVPKGVSSDLLVGDIAKDFLFAAERKTHVAWDIETSGLDWASERVGFCQLYVPSVGIQLVKMKKNCAPQNLVRLLSNPNVTKVFHHAMFDLRFLCYHWNTRAANVVCTKIASKLIAGDKSSDHSLSSLLKHYFGVVLDKRERTSDWLTWQPSAAQMEYLSNDVIHLPNLYDLLTQKLQELDRLELAKRCFEHLPTRVELEIGHFGDVFQY